MAAAEQGAWRRIAEAPIPPAGGMATAWTGRQLVVWGGGSGGGGNWQPSAAGAAYDPAADRWEVLPAAPVPGRIGASAVWTGREMIVWGGFGRCCPIDSVIHDPAAAAFDPATNRWRRVADVPSPWSGDDGYAATVVDEGRPLIWRRGHLGADDPASNTWSEVSGVRPPPAAPAPGPSGAPPPSGSTTDPVALAAVGGGGGNGSAGGGGAGGAPEVFTWIGNTGQRLEGLAYRPSTSTWRRTAPLDAQTGSAIVAAGADRLFVAAGQSARVLEYRIGEDRWEELPLPPIPTRSAAALVWTGTELLVWGGAGDEGPEMDGAIWHCC